MARINPMDRLGLKLGDYVTRRGQCCQQDWFKCHEFSFGQVVDFSVETEKTRPDAADKSGEQKWIEVNVIPFDLEMAPEKERPWISWAPEECIKISRFNYTVRALTWPFIKVIFNKPCDGIRITDF